MDEFPGNSNRERQGQQNPQKTQKPLSKKPPTPAKEEKVVEKIVTGTVVEKKKTFGSKIKDVFIGGDFKSAAGYIAADVLLPALRTMIFEAITEGGRRMIFGDGAAPQQRRPGRGNGPHVSYNTPVSRYSPTRRGHVGEPRETPSRQQDVIFYEPEDAERVLDKLAEYIAKFEVASLSDFKKLVGLPSSYVDNSWGWFTINYFEIRQTNEGFILIIPDPQPIT